MCSAENTHQAHIIKVRIEKDTSVAWVPFRIIHLNSFDCIPGDDFCASYLVGIPDFGNRQLHLRDQHGQMHTVTRDGNFRLRRKLDLIVPHEEVLKLLRTPRCLSLWIQPLDQSKELKATTKDFALKRSKLNGQ